MSDDDNVASFTERFSKKKRLERVARNAEKGKIPTYLDLVANAIDIFYQKSGLDQHDKSVSKPTVTFDNVYYGFKREIHTMITRLIESELKERLAERTGVMRYVDDEAHLRPGKARSIVEIKQKYYGPSEDGDEKLFFAVADNSLIRESITEASTELFGKNIFPSNSHQR